MQPQTLSRYLREEDHDADLARRRWAVGLSMVGVGAGVIVSLYQTGVIRHLPDPPKKLTGDLFDSDKVDASSYAYKRAQTPDALMMIVTYGLTALLAGAGGPNRPRRQPWLPIAAAAKALFDAATTVKLGREEWKENKAFCAYCQAATVASFATVAATLPEGIRAVRRLAGRS